MRRIIASILALALLLALALPALADADIMYVNRDTLKVYKEKSKDSRVLKTLKGGQKLLIETRSGGWYGILVEDAKHGGQRMGWVQGKYLSRTMPPEYCNHKWSNWEVHRQATCTRSGLRTRYCKICGLSMSDDIPKTGHSFGPWKVRKQATCVRKGERVRTCKICGYEEKEQYYADHEYGSWKTTKEPTCTETGERVRTCKVCGHEDEQPLDKLPHDYEWRVIVEPTDHSAGTRARICVNCGHNGGQESFDPEGTLRRGDRGEGVRAMQQALVEQGCLNAGGVDGIFGGGTEKAVMQFQREQGFIPDGVAWPQTLKRLLHDDSSSQAVEPLPVDLNVNALPDGVYPVAFDRGDVANLASGVYMNAVRVYTMDIYAAADVEGLAAGDTIVIGGEPCEVNSVEHGDNAVKVNGGLEQDGFELVALEDGEGYRVWSYDDLATYTERGTTTLVLDPSAVFIDSSDPEGESVCAKYQGIVGAMQESPIQNFDEYNTTVRIESGSVVEINRVYTP